MKIRNYLFLLLLFCPLIGNWADIGIEVVNTVFIPKEYYVGDKVELRVKLNVEDGYKLQIPEALPESSWIDIDTVNIIEDDNLSEIRVSFTSFIPGTRSLPTLFLGDAILNSVKIHTSSLIDSTERKFIGIADQLLLPGTKLGLIILVGGLFTGPVLLLILLGPLRRKFINFINKDFGRRPVKRLNKVLKDLEIQIAGISCRRFYIKLSGAVRDYLSIRSNIDFTTMTTADMRTVLLYTVADIDLAESIYKMMQLSDNIKFGKLTTNDDIKMNDIRLIKKLSVFIELKLKNRDLSGGSV
jgi:hypothetical protein